MSYKDLPGRFYTTSAPGSKTLPMFDTIEQALDRARTELAKDKETRYVVMIVAKVQTDAPPVRVTRYDGGPDTGWFDK